MAKRKAKKKTNQKDGYPEAPKSSDFKTMDMGIDDTPDEGRNLVPFVAAGLIIFLSFIWFVAGTSQEADDMAPDETATYLYEIDVSLMSADGSAEISYDGVDWQALGMEADIPSRSYVRTGDDSRVVLSMDEGLSMITLDENSQLLISSLSSVSPSFEPMQGAVHYQLQLVGNRTYGIELIDTTVKAETVELISYTNTGITELYVIAGGVWTADGTGISAGQSFKQPDTVREKPLPTFLESFLMEIESTRT